MRSSLSVGAFLWTALVLCMGCSTPEAHQPREEPSLEHKLAVIQRGVVSEDDQLVSAFTQVLDRLESKCPETRQQIADMGVRAQELLTEENINEPLLDVFLNIAASIPSEAPGGAFGPCIEIFAAYLTLRSGP